MTSSVEDRGLPGHPGSAGHRVATRPNGSTGRRWASKEDTGFTKLGLRHQLDLYPAGHLPDHRSPCPALSRPRGHKHNQVTGRTPGAEEPSHKGSQPFRRCPPAGQWLPHERGAGNGEEVLPGRSPAHVAPRGPGKSGRPALRAPHCTGGCRCSALPWLGHQQL